MDISVNIRGFCVTEEITYNGEEYVRQENDEDGVRWYTEEDFCCNEMHNFLDIGPDDELEKAYQSSKQGYASQF